MGKKITISLLSVLLICSIIFGCKSKSPAELFSNNCDMHLTVSVSDTIINNLKKGAFTIHAHSGSGFLFQLSNNGPAQSDSTFTNLDPSDYRVYVTNSIGCKDSIDVTINP
jgi:hypothetical protein